MSNIPQSRVEKILHSMYGETGIQIEPPQSRVEEDLLKLKEAIDAGGGSGGGTNNYNNLINKPTLNGVEISGDKTSTDYDLQSSGHGTYDPDNENVIISDL